MYINKVLVLQPPSPPFMNVKRDYAGGFGVADPSKRETFGHDPEYISMPFMSALYVASVLERDGFEVGFLDAQAEGFSLGETVRKVMDFSPDAVVAVLNLPSIYGDLEVIKNMREAFPKTKVITIGTVGRALNDLILASKDVDVVILADPEVIVTNLLRNFHQKEKTQGIAFRRDGQVVVTPGLPRITDLDALPYPAYHLAPSHKYWYHVFGRGKRFAGVFTSKGCNFGCYYCPYPFGFGKEVLYRNPKKVVDEIQWLQELYGVQGIVFRDQILTVPNSHAEALCDEIVRREVKIRWVIETRLDSVNGPLLRKMKEAGLKRIHYGLESGDSNIFTSVGKNKVAGNLNKMIEVVRITEKVGVDFHIFILIGLLGETWETIENTIKTLEKIRPLTIQVSICTPYPGTPLFNWAKNRGLLLTEDWSQYTGFKSVMRTDALSAEDLLKAKGLIEQEHRRMVKWKRIRKKADLTIKYTVDGSIGSRLKRKLKVALG